MYDFLLTPEARDVRDEARKCGWEMRPHFYSSQLKISFRFFI